MAPERVGPLELLAIDHLLRDDERDIQATVRKLVAERIRPYVADWYEAATFPAHSPKVERVRLADLPNTTVNPMIILFVPPLSPRAPAAEIFEWFDEPRQQVG